MHSKKIKGPEEKLQDFMCNNKEDSKQNAEELQAIIEELIKDQEGKLAELKTSHFIFKGASIFSGVIFSAAFVGFCLFVTGPQKNNIQLAIAVYMALGIFAAATCCSVTKYNLICAQMDEAAKKIAELTAELTQTEKEKSKTIISSQTITPLKLDQDHTIVRIPTLTLNDSDHQSGMNDSGLNLISLQSSEITPSKSDRHTSALNTSQPKKQDGNLLDQQTGSLSQSKLPSLDSQETKRKYEKKKMVPKIVENVTPETIQIKQKEGKVSFTDLHQGGEKKEKGVQYKK